MLSLSITISQKQFPVASLYTHSRKHSQHTTSLTRVPFRHQMSHREDEPGSSISYEPDNPQLSATTTTAGAAATTTDVVSVIWRSCFLAPPSPDGHRGDCLEPTQTTTSSIHLVIPSDTVWLLIFKLVLRLRMPHCARFSCQSTLSWCLVWGSTF